MDADVRAKGASWRWPLLVSVVILNICLPSLVLSYGVLLVRLVDHQVPIWLGLSTPTILILTYGFTQCWCREAADSWGGPVGYRVMATVGLLMVVISLFLCAFVPFNWQPYIYGILGGFGSSLISAQVDAVVFDTYDNRLGFIIRALCFAGQAIGQSVFPHILTALIDYYDYSYFYIVFSGVMLQTLPAILLLRVDDSIMTPVSFSRYSDLSRTYAVFSNEAAEINNYSNELQLHDLSKKCWKSPSDDNIHREDKNNKAAYDNDISATITPPPSPEEKRRNIFGVEILPEIPEESEEEDDYAADKSKNHKKRFSVAIKRLSILGDNIDDCISNQSRKDSQGSDNREYTEVVVTYDNISPVTDIHRERVFNSFSFRCQSAYASLRRKIWIPSYRVYRMKRRFIYSMYNFNDTFIKPLTRSLSYWRFYPCLLLLVARLILTAVSLPLLPLIASQMHPRISTTESNFMLSLYAYTWICFLFCTPWLTQTNKGNYKYISLSGLIISTFACFEFADTSCSHDTFAFGIVIAGFGYGALTSCWETTVQDFVGPRKWPKIHSTLETLSACCLAAFLVGISFVIGQKGGLQTVMFIMGITLACITCVWTVLVLITLYLTKLQTFRLGGSWLK